MVYGGGGVGKSSLAALAPKPVFIDIDNGTSRLDVRRVDGVETYMDVRGALHSPDPWVDCETVVIDTGTALQELALAYTLATVPHEKGKPIARVEDYGFGKGYRHWYDSCVLLLGDLDAHRAAGRHVILLCHEVTEKAPNPDGDEYLRYEPNLLQQGKEARFRDRVKNWCDHLLYMSFDKEVKDGKAKGTGTRTVYPTERPTYWAKSRPGGLREPVFCAEGSDKVWRDLGIIKETA